MTKTAAANRAAIARRRQRVSTTSGNNNNNAAERRPVRTATERPVTERLDPPYHRRAGSLGDSTPTTSNTFLSNKEEAEQPKQAKRKEVKRLDQHRLSSTENNPYLAQTPQQQQQRVASRVAVPLQPQQQPMSRISAPLQPQQQPTSHIATPSQPRQPTSRIYAPLQPQQPSRIATPSQPQQPTSRITTPLQQPTTSRIATPSQQQQMTTNRQEENSESNMTEDDYLTAVEDPEPNVDGKEILDATVLHHKSNVVVKAFTTCQALGSQERDTKHLAEVSHHLGEVLELHVKTPSNSDSVIRYGQPVLLYSRKAKGYLGVRTITTNEDVGFEVGFYRTTVSPVELWTILHGNRKLLVGSAARTVVPSRRGFAVRAGESLILRNNLIGGILSLSSTAGLSLVTQSYDSNDAVASRQSLVDRALRHYEIYPSNKEEFQIWHSFTPPCPNWTYEETSDKKVTNSPSSPNLKEMTPMDQEKLLLDEVIGSLMGLEGNVIRKRDQGDFYLAVTMDRSLKNLVERILPTSTAYSNVKTFLQQHQPGYEYGLVVQAMCHEMDAIVGEYLAGVETLDTRFRSGGGVVTRLTMNLLFVEIQQMASTMTLLQQVISSCAQDKIGGCLLNAIYNLQMTSLVGDGYKVKLLQRLVDKASIPWMNMLSRWLTTGELEDTCGEFMIVRNNQKKFKGDNWNEIFSINKLHVFRGAIASQQLEEKVLTTGRNWKAVLRCQKTVGSGGESTSEHCVLRYSGDPSTLATYIENTHKKASVDLLELLFGRFKIEDTLITLKRYFLLDQGDFLVHFMDAAEPELTKLVEDISVGRTQHWLNMALLLTDSSDPEMPAMSTGPQPLTPHSIRCFFAEESLDVILGVRDGEAWTPSRHPYGQVAGLTGMLAFTLDFPEVPFPTSLLLSRINLKKYQMLFRHVFYTKHIEQRLVGVWLDNQTMKEFHSIRGLLGPTFLLRQRMLHFIQNFMYYMMLEVIEPKWLTMMELIKKQETIDDVIAIHKNFLERVIEDCLLSNVALFKSLAKVMSTCLTFSELMRRFVETTGIQDSKKQKKQPTKRRNRKPGTRADRTKAMHAARDERQALLAKQTSLIERELKNDTFQRMIRRHEEVFDDNLDEFMRKLRTVGHQSQITNLCIRLDYNGFLSDRTRR